MPEPEGHRHSDPRIKGSSSVVGTAGLKIAAVAWAIAVSR